MPPPSSLRGSKIGLLTGLLTLVPCALQALASEATQDFHLVFHADTVHLRWSASVHEGGGEFRFGPNLDGLGSHSMVLSAVEGVGVYEADWTLGAGSGTYALVYRSANGSELVLASVLVVRESFEPAAAVEGIRLQRPVVETFGLILPHPETPWTARFHREVEGSSQPSPEPTSPPPRA